jgi:hypothetical protein
MTRAETFIKAIFFLSTMLICSAAGLVSAQEPDPINELFFKGTHNSYACRDLCNAGIANTCPVMHHHPEQQIDDFGVWALELDFGTERRDGALHFIVGHDGPECPDESWTNCSWGPELEKYFERIRRTKAMSYRPIFIVLEKKGWDDNPPPREWVPRLEHFLKDVFNADGGDHIYGPAKFCEESSKWPTVPYLAGKVVPIVIGGDTLSWNDYFSDFIFYKDVDGYILYKDNNGIAQRTGLRRSPSHDTCDDNNLETFKSETNNTDFNFLAADQYQYDWTFLEHIERWAPPNPIVVDKAAPPENDVSNAEDPDGTGECWKYQYCLNSGCTPSDFKVTQHGTFRFPFDSVNKGVKTAKPGWTLLIKAGNYPERVTISKTLTLKADGGLVVIGSH